MLQARQGSDRLRPTHLRAASGRPGGWRRALRAGRRSCPAQQAPSATRRRDVRCWRASAPALSHFATTGSTGRGCCRVVEQLLQRRGRRRVHRDRAAFHPCDGADGRSLERCRGWAGGRGGVQRTGRRWPAAPTAPRLQRTRRAPRRSVSATRSPRTPPPDRSRRRRWPICVQLSAALTNVVECRLALRGGRRGASACSYERQHAAAHRLLDFRQTRVRRKVLLRQPPRRLPDLRVRDWSRSRESTPEGRFGSAPAS